MRILIVEDERATAQLLGMLLSTSGHTVVHALDGTEGLRELRATPCDLVVSDVYMAPMDGFTFLAQARLEFPRLLVVLASASTDLHARVEKQPHKPFDIVHKPFRIEEVKRVLARAAEALAVQACIAQASVAAPKSVQQDASERLTEGLARQFPGAGYAQTRAALTRAMRQTGHVLVVAERGLLGPEGLDLWREQVAPSTSPWQVVDVGEDRAAARDQLLNGDEAGAAIVAARGGTLVVLQLETLVPADQARVFAHLRGQPATRVIASVNRDPDVLLDEGLIDEGIYFRLGSLAVPVPSVVDLAEHVESLFVAALREAPGFAFGSTDVQIEASALGALRSYRWPGNLVEMRAVAHWTVSQMRGPRVTVAQFPERLQQSHLKSLSEALVSSQREYLRRVARINPNPHEAAQALGLSVEDFTSGQQADGPCLFSLGSREGRADSPRRVPSATTDSAPRAPGFLLVSSPAEVRHPVGAYLGQMGLPASEAADGLQALAELALNPRPPSVVIIAGPPAPFSPEELVGQLRRMSPDLVLATIGVEGDVAGVHSFPALESMDVFPGIVSRLLEASPR